MCNVCDPLHAFITIQISKGRDLSVLNSNTSFIYIMLIRCILVYKVTGCNAERDGDVKCSLEYCVLVVEGVSLPLLHGATLREQCLPVTAAALITLSSRCRQLPCLHVSSLLLLILLTLSVRGSPGVPLYMK